MTEPGAGPRGEFVEIPLVVEEPVSTPGDVEPPKRPNWRRVVGVATAGGAALGIGVAVLMLSSDPDTDPDPDTGAEPGVGLGPVELSTQITTPPTLTPLDTLPPPDITRPPAGADAPQATSSQDRSLFEQTRRPEYPEIPGVPPAELVRYDISGAVERLGTDVPRRSETHLELGTGGYVMDVTIVRDPERDRYHITITLRGRTQVVIVDNATETSYVNPGTDDLRLVANAEVLAGTTAATVNEFFDKLLLGPIRPDTLDEAATLGRGLVTIDGVGVVREFVSIVDGELVPEWQVYAFGPVYEFPVEDRPSRLEYAAYVDGTGRIVQVDGVASIGNVPQSVQHRLFLLDEDPVIEIPPPATTPLTTSPTTPPATTPPVTTPPVTTPPATATE